MKVKGYQKANWMVYARHIIHRLTSETGAFVEGANAWVYPASFLVWTSCGDVTFPCAAVISGRPTHAPSYAIDEMPEQWLAGLSDGCRIVAHWSFSEDGRLIELRFSAINTLGYDTWEWVALENALPAIEQPRRRARASR